MLPRIAIFLALFLAVACATAAAPTGGANVRAELEQAYARNRAAFLASDAAAVMALRTDDFQTVAPDGTILDRAANEARTRGFLAGIVRWIAIEEEIESLEINGSEAIVTVRQHLIRMVRRSDDREHRLETWARQRETWRRTPEGWKLARVDEVRDQRRLVDGQPG